MHFLKTLYLHFDTVEIWIGIAYGQILSIFYTVICLWHDNEGGGRVLSFHIFRRIVERVYSVNPVQPSVYLRQHPALAICA